MPTERCGSPRGGLLGLGKTVRKKSENNHATINYFKLPTGY